jgi:hypothetical protein
MQEAKAPVMKVQEVVPREDHFIGALSKEYLEAEKKRNAEVKPLFIKLKTLFLLVQLIRGKEVTCFLAKPLN